MTRPPVLLTGKTCICGHEHMSDEQPTDMCMEFDCPCDGYTLRNPECQCDVTAPDEFGNRDLIENPGCSIHGCIDREYE